MLCSQLANQTKGPGKSASAMQSGINEVVEKVRGKGRANCGKDSFLSTTLLAAGCSSPRDGVNGLPGLFVWTPFSADAHEGTCIEIPVTALRKVDERCTHLREQKAT